MTGTRTRLVLGALGVAVATACSSAPAPESLTQNGGTTGDVQTPATTGDVTTGTTGTLAPGASGTTGVVAPGTTGSGTTGGNATGGTTGSAGSTGGGGTTGSVVQTRSHLFTAAEDRIGITKTSINLCAHAALTYGAAFNTSDADLNVFWEALNTEKGGIFGRKVTVSYENDNYDPNTAVTAAQTCADKKIFMLLGGIGFDQIPTVRRWAESHRMLYLHHTATVEGSKGLKYSFTELPTVERMGDGFGQLFASKYRGKRVGIVERDSPNWRPGANHFKAALQKLGQSPVADQLVVDKKGNYTSDIVALKNAKAEVVFLWENALNAVQFIKQAKVQAFNPTYLMFPFNLTSQTLNADALQPPLQGVAMYPAYSKGDYTGPFASYADDMKLFEQQYAKYRPNVDLGGVGGDLLFLNWVGQKVLAAQLRDCGPDCTRNKFVDTLQSYKKVPTSSGCLIDFTRGDGQHGSDALNFMEAYRARGGDINWRNTRSCVRP
jgi:ABC-type branched-subunit amino acid transport system substrate-binding protein